MRPLRVLHVTPYSPSAWAYGGIPRVVSALTRQLARDDHHVTICTTDAHDSSTRLQPPGGTTRSRISAWPLVEDANGIETRVFPNLSNAAAYHWQAFAPLGLGRFLHERAGTFDVAHLHACRNLPGVIAGRHLRRAGIPYVLAPNGTAPRLERRLAAKAAFDVLAGQRLLDGAAAVLAVTLAERQQLLRLGVPDDRIHVIPNPVDLDEFESPADPDPFRRRFSLGADPIVLYLGKHTPRKRLDLLVEAFARVGQPHAQLVIAGNDMGAGTDLRGLVATLGLASRTTFTGLLEGRDRLAALTAADVVVYPSEDEIFGLVPLEALLSGTPVVVADDSGCGEVIRSTGGGHVVPLGRAGELAAAIDDVLASPARWNAEAARAAGEVRRRFAAGTVTAELTDVYARLSGRRATAPPPVRSIVPAEEEAAPAGVSFVVPVRNGGRWIDSVMRAIRAQRTARDIELIVVNDGSTDDSAARLEELAERGPLRILEGRGRGAAAAVNLGVAVARHALIAQVDQDVVLDPGWLEALAVALADPSVAAAQGRYVTHRGASAGARVMSLDLEWRYLAMATREPDHVCTGNSIYRASAFRDVGGLDESMGYGYDNDMSYRLRADGHRLVYVPDATSRHEWREGLIGYCTQQYGLGYGRIDLVAKHPSRVAGDDVSPASMMAHPILMALAILSVVTGVVTGVALAWTGGGQAAWFTAGAGIVLALAVERLIVGARAAFRFNDRAALLFPVFHLARDLSWVCAIGAWSWHRLSRRRHKPARSMQPRPAPQTSHAAPDSGAPTALPADARILGIIPAHNEAATLPSVLADLRARCPDLDVLVVDDGSTDGTADVLESLGVRWLRFPERMGIGSAMRAGLQYAKRLGYRAAVRIDGDGQHRAGDIRRILGPIRDGTADVALGSRYRLTGPRVSRAGGVGMIKRLLAACLSHQTGSIVTDATSGFCALGPRAVRLLADHHPTGYPEPELRLLLRRNGLRAIEIPVRDRPRLGGQSSLTPGRITVAGARVLLAMLVVPFRPVVTRPDGD